MGFGVELAANTIADYRESLPTLRVGPRATRSEVAKSLSPELPDDATPLEEVINELVTAATPGLRSTAGPRYFGFVVGGSVDGALVADLLATGWDQPAWAALRSMGRSGIAELIERCCSHARYFAKELAAIEGIDVVNDVVLNQVLVRVGDANTTAHVERWIHQDGTSWLGSTTWRGERLLRISVSNWMTTESDVDLTVATIAAARRDALASR